LTAGDHFHDPRLIVVSIELADLVNRLGREVTALEEGYVLRGEVEQADAITDAPSLLDAEFRGERRAASYA